MNEKKLWKIEELWNLNYKDKKDIPKVIYSELNRKITENYSEGISKYYPRFHLKNSFDFESSKENVFKDDYGGYKGLKKLQLIIKDKPIYLFDNHNEIIFPFVEVYDVLGQQGFLVVHIDAHPDDAVFHGKKIKVLNINDVEGFIKKTRISDFFDAISETRITKSIYRVTHSNDFEFFIPPEEPYTLSLDIDIFGPEGDFVELKDKVSAINKAWNGAMAICIATSPGFIDQNYAQKIIEIISK